MDREIKMSSISVDKLKDELSRLIGCACDGMLSEDQRLRLNHLLEEHRELRAHYLKYIAIHSCLTTTAGSQATRGLDELRDRIAATSVFSLTRFTRSSWRKVGTSFLRAAAVLLILTPPANFVGKWIGGGSGTQLAEIAVSQTQGESQIANHKQVFDRWVARITRVSSEARWRNPNESFAIDSRIRTGVELKLLEGEVELEYGSGVKVLLIGPADFTLAEVGGDLHRGGLMASVPPAGHGFTIATPNGKVVDLGTEFGVMVDDFGVSEVSVFEGKVEAFPASKVTPGEGKIRLTKGNALQWNDGMLKSLDADLRRLPITMASYTRHETEQFQATASLSADFRSGKYSQADWKILGDVKLSERGLLLGGQPSGKEVPFLISRAQFDPTLGPVTVVCDVRFPEILSKDLPSFSILTRSASDRTSMERAWKDLLSTCVRCNFRSATDGIDGLLESSTKYERDRELTTLSWRGFRRPQNEVLYRVTMRDDGVNVSFTVTEVDNPSVTKTVVCRSLFQGYDNYIALEGWNQGTVRVEKLEVFQEISSKKSSEHSTRFAFATQKQSRRDLQKNHNPLYEHIPDGSTLVVEDRFDDEVLNSKHWTILGDVQLQEGNVALGPSKEDNHIDTFHLRPYLLTKQKFAPIEGKVFVLGKIEFDDNFLQGYGGSFAVMSRSLNNYGKGPEWAASALGTGIRCNLWPASPRIEHNLEIHEKATIASLTFLQGGALAINPRSKSYYFLMEDSGTEAAITFQDVNDPSVVGTVRHETTADAPRSGYIGFESTWGSSVLLDDIQIYIKSTTKSED